MTGNTRYFYASVAPHVARVIVVNLQFKVISESVKKTDHNDAQALALFLSKDLLPEVRMKDETRAEIASLTQTRQTLVELRTRLKNKINNIFSAHGINLAKETLSSPKMLDSVLAHRFDTLVAVELKVLVEQVRALNKSIAELEQTIKDEGGNSKATATLPVLRALVDCRRASCCR